jgi:iron complex outermembrane receptor protein
MFITTDSEVLRPSSPRASLALLLSSLLLPLLPATTFAQDQGDEETSLEEVIVTGTRKAGLSPLETLSPVSVIGGMELGQQGASDLTDTLTKVSPAINTQRFPIADGTAFIRPVTLRNLAPDQTLVLIDGTRRHRSALVNLQLAPLGTVNQGSQAVDFSAIPAVAIQRVEVLRDGASAQYGSDAIAGVINVILKNNNEGGELNAQYGEYTEGDGERFNVNGNIGLPLGEDGFFTISAEWSGSDITSRGQARPDAAAVADIVGAELVPYNGLGQRWGDPDVDALKIFLNSAIYFNENFEIYANASYMDSETRGGFFYRGPVLPAQYGIAGRPTLIRDLNGDFLPDNADPAFVASIIAQGFNPADYLTASASSPSGWVELNPIYTQFPGGYSPIFGADISDYAIVAGARGMVTQELSWDFTLRTAEDEVEYVL